MILVEVIVFGICISFKVKVNAKMRKEMLIRKGRKVKEKLPKDDGLGPGWGTQDQH